jgi:hypothetical protein
MSESQKTQCCERDDDFDGNCDIHSAPGVYLCAPSESIRIYPTLISVHARQPDVSASETVTFLISKYGGLQPADVLHHMCSLFVPSFTDREARDAFSELLNQGKIKLTSDRFLDVIS